MVNNLQIVADMASYERFHCYDVPMVTNFNKYWTNHCELKSLSKPVVIIPTRKGVIEKIKNITKEFSAVILNQYYSYEAKKPFVMGKNPLEKQLNFQAMDNMAKIYANQMMNPILDEVLKIKKILPKIEEHFEQYIALLNGDNKNEDCLQKAKALIKDVHLVRKDLNENLLFLSHRSKEIIEKMREMNARGKEIGPAFQANPVIFLMGAPMLLTKKSGLIGIEIEEAIKVIEGIKQVKCVAGAVEPFYLLFLNATQAMRKMEKSLATTLGKYYEVEDGFNRESPFIDASLRSDRRTSFNSLSFDENAGKLKVEWDQDSKKAPEVTPGILEVLKPLTPEEIYLNSMVSHLTCQDTNMLFVNPVLLETGYTFEQNILDMHLEKDNTCPISGAVLTTKKYVPNLTLKALIQRFVSCPLEKRLEFFKEVPEFESAISLETLTAPIVVSSGMTYDKDDIEQLFNGESRSCPLTRIELDTNVRIPNRTLEALINAQALNNNDVKV